MRDILQAYVSPTLSHFKERLFSCWGFIEYYDPLAPAFFFGLYTDYDIRVLTKHKAKSLLYFGGNDFREKQISIVKKLNNIICIGYGGDWLYEGCQKENLRFTPNKLLIMEFDKFKPVPLGDKIYVYRGLKGNRADYFGWSSVVQPVMNIIGEDRFIFADNLSLSELHEKVYSNSFVYLKPNDRGGSTALFELGHMGIRTITNGHSKFPNALSYSSIEDIVSLIREEEKRIGTHQYEVAESLKAAIVQDDAWLMTSSYDWQPIKKNKIV